MFQQFSIEGEIFGRFATGQVATEKSVVGPGAGQTRRRKNKIQVRTAGDGKPVRVFLAAAERNVMRLEDQLSVLRRCEIEQTTAPVALQFASVGVIQNEHWLQPGIDDLGGTFGQQALAFPSGDLEVICGVRGSAPIDHRFDGNFRGAGGGMIGRRREGFGLIADNEGARVGNAKAANRPDFVGPRWDIRGDGDNELVCFRLVRGLARFLAGGDIGLREAELAQFIQIGARHADFDRGIESASRWEN